MKRIAKLGDIEFTVIETEEPVDSVTITDNSVEKGQDVSDHVKQEASIINLSGAMTGSDASSKLNKLRRYQREGKLLKYIGRNIYDNMAIQTMNRSHGKKVKNGFEFSITLKQVRIATAKKVEINAGDPITKEKSKELDTKVKPKTNKGKQQPKTKPVVESPADIKRTLPSPKRSVPPPPIKGSKPQGPKSNLNAIAVSYSIK